MQIQSTLAVARELGVPEWRLGRLVRDGAIEAPPLLAGRRLWSARHVRAAETALRRAGLIAPILDPVDAAIDFAAELEFEDAERATGSAPEATEHRL